MTATRASLGTARLNSSRPLTLVSVIITESPVMLPPGRERLVTWPVATGSAWPMKTMGIVEVARFAASV